MAWTLEVGFVCRKATSYIFSPNVLKIRITSLSFINGSMICTTCTQSHTGHYMQAVAAILSFRVMAIAWY